jgi:chromosome segregation protein
VRENGIRAEELRSEEERARNAAEEARRELADQEERSTGCLDERAGLEQRLRGAQERREEARDAVRRIEERQEAGRKEAEALRRSLEETSFRDREAAAGLERLREQLLAEHDLDFHYFTQERGPFGPPLPPGRDGAGREILGPPLPPAWSYPEEGIPDLRREEGFDPGRAREQTARVRRRLERIGSVNLRAVEDLAEEEGAVKQLAAEEEDLRQGRIDLGRMIEHINQESSRLFQETFARARENFQEIFRKLFQGGKADILLGESEDPLEAGIDIVARPPGKKLQNINLLSGGERSLCALAILFSVFKVKPSPFAVLDEVDAALDDSNVDRFLDVLADFTDRTQFLVVTHNKRTMEFAGVLYGVTMQRKGISTCVSVRLDQVDQVESA